LLAAATLAELEQRRTEIRAQLEALQRECGRKLPKGAEPPRNKVHWDYLLEEGEWMAKDFALERKWKLMVAKKLARAVMRYVGRFRAASMCFRSISHHHSHT
jgi:hypothetical protein